MKKIGIVVITLLTSLTISGIAFAGTPTDCTNSYAFADTDGCYAGATSKLTLKSSKNVKFSYQNQSAGLTYTLGACHIQGDKTYSSSSGDQKIWYKAISTTGTCETPPDEPTGFGLPAVWTGWSSL